MMMHPGMLIVLAMIAAVTSTTSSASTMSSIEDLRASMEADSPGSVEAFVKWGEEESKIEYYRELIEGRIPVPLGFKTLRLSDLSAFIFYLYAPESVEVIASALTKAIQRGVFASDNSMPDLVSRIVKIHTDLTTLPANVFGMFWRNEPPQSIFNALQPSSDHRFTTVERIGALMRIWRGFCIDDLASRRYGETSRPPCHIDPASGLWVLGKHAATSFIRTNLLLVIRRRGCVAAAPLPAT